MPRMVVLVLALLLVAPAGARAATRYAATDGSSKSSACAADAPCTLARAVNDAAAGDEIVIGPGEYPVGATLRPRERVDLHGDRDHAVPRLVATASPGDGLILFKSGTLGHLALEADAGLALKLKSGTVDGLRVASASGDGVLVDGSGAGTVVRNSVVTAAGTALFLKNQGDVTLRNVTVMAPDAAGVAIEADIDDTASLVNVIARGGGSDAVVDHGTVTAAFSNFRPDHSPGVSAGAGNQSDEPLFADADYRPAPGSPTIDAGALDAFAASPDPDGHARSLGAAPDIGAYEFVPVPKVGGGDDGDTQTETQMPDDVLGVPVPKQGVSVVVGATSGEVRIRRPGADGFEPLDEAARVPVGSVLDARRGRVRLVSAIGSGGAVQSGVFWGTRFRATQSRRGGGMTTLSLRGPELRGCGRHVAHAGAVAMASRKHKRRRRTLWGSDNHGRFRTHGHDSVATARGTRWLTRETCRWTLTRVREGAVMVQDLRRHRRVLVTAGHSYLAVRHP